MNILSVDYYAENAAKDFTTSLKETGFAVLKRIQLTGILFKLFTKNGRIF